jgi:hypothetical protein
MAAYVAVSRTTATHNNKVPSYVEPTAAADATRLDVVNLAFMLGVTTNLAARSILVHTNHQVNVLDNHAAP